MGNLKFMFCIMVCLAVAGLAHGPHVSGGLEMEWSYRKPADVPADPCLAMVDHFTGMFSRGGVDLLLSTSSPSTVAFEVVVSYIQDGKVLQSRRVFNRESIAPKTRAFVETATGDVVLVEVSELAPSQRHAFSIPSPQQ